MITITYHFHNRRQEDLDQINSLLSVMKLEDLQLEDATGYLATSTNAQGVLLNQRYGLDSGKLICHIAKDGGGNCYRIDTCVEKDNLNPDDCLQHWRDSHPDRAMRIALVIGFDDVNGYLIVHHEKS